MNTTVATSSLAVFLCPSEVNPQPFDSDLGTTGVNSYGWCLGDWYVWGGFAMLPNRTAFSPNRSRRQAEFTDGMSWTLLASEVRARQFERTDCGGLSGIINPRDVPSPATPPGGIPGLGDGSTCKQSNGGHTAWADGQVDQTGMTTAWSPNTKVYQQSSSTVFDNDLDDQVDLDLIGIRESHGGPTFAAVTSRSYHPGGVNALFGNGSVRFVKGSVDGSVWRALGSVAGGEIISSSDF
jgi:hypothetical protein